MEDNARERALAQAEANPQAALVFAVLDLASAIRENGCELENIAKHHEQLAANVGGIDAAITDLGKEIAHLPVTLGDLT